MGFAYLEPESLTTKQTNCQKAKGGTGGDADFDSLMLKLAEYSRTSVFQSYCVLK